MKNDAKLYENDFLFLPLPFSPSCHFILSRTFDGLI